MPGPSNGRPSASEEVEPKRRKLNQYCYAHQDDDAEIVFRCQSGHGLCLECLRNFCSSGLPQTCAAENCNVHLDSVEIIKSFPSEEKALYEDKMADAIALVAARKEQGEATRRCPKCYYMEVADNTAVGEPFQCKNIHCAHYIEPSPLDTGLALLESAVIPVKCPRCSTPTTLDWGCMQIACETVGCKANYCYCCGQLFDDNLDVHAGYMEAHYDNNPQCVKMAEEWHERDPSWPENQDLAVEKFHEWAIRRNLVESLEKNKDRLTLAMESNRGEVLLRDVGLTFKEVLELEIEPLPVAHQISPPSPQEEEMIRQESFDERKFRGMIIENDLQGIRDLFVENPPLQPCGLILRAMSAVGNIHSFDTRWAKDQPDTISTEILQFLIDSNADIHYGGGRFISAIADYGPALNSVVERGLPRNVVEFLLDRQADVNRLSRRGNGSSVLHEAARNGMDEIIELLLDRGANMELRDDEGRTPVFSAVRPCRREIEFLRYSRQRDRGGYSPEEIANQQKVLDDLLRRKKGIVDILHSRGANISRRTNNNGTLIGNASLQRDPSSDFVRHVAEMFMHNGEYVEEVFQFLIRLADDDKTCKYIAENRPQEPEKLLATAIAGFSLLAKENDEFQRPRISDVMLSHLVDLGADIPKSDCLQRAVSNNMSISVLKFLVDHNAKVGTDELSNKAPLQFAVQELQPDIVQFLIDNGSNANVLLNGSGQSLYHIALGSIDDMPYVSEKKRLVKCLRKLAEAGANINVKTDRCKTPLDVAIVGKLGSDVEALLIEKGAQKTWRYKLKAFFEFLKVAEGTQRGEQTHYRFDYSFERFLESPDVIRTDEHEFGGGPRPAYPGEDVELSQLLFGLMKTIYTSVEFTPHDDSLGASESNFPNVLADYLIDLRADPNYCHEPTGETVLSTAIENCNIEFVKHLVSRGAHVQPDPAHHQPLVVAAHMARLDVVKFLISEGASTSLASNRMSRLLRGQMSTPLNAAIRTMHFQEDLNSLLTVSELQEETKVKYEQIGKLIMEDRMKIMDCLLEAGAQINEDENVGPTALGVAWQENKPEEVLKFLVTKSQNLDSAIAKGQSLLYFLTECATNEQHLDKEARIRLINFVLDRGCNVDVLTTDGYEFTPLMNSCGWIDKDLVDLFLGRGANAKLVDTDGQTCIHLLIFKFRDVIFGFGDSSVPDLTSEPDIALENSKKIILALIAAGVDVNKRDIDGLTALDLSEQEQTEDLSTFLKNECGAIQSTEDEKIDSSKESE